MPAARLRRLYTTLESLIREVGRFGVVGAVNVVVDVGLFNLLRSHVLENKPVTDKVLSTSVAIVSSYFMNRHWTWAHRARRGVRRELPIFLVLSLVGLGIAAGCLAVSHYLLGFRSTLADNVSANVVGLVLGMVWRFWSFKRWVFPAALDAGGTAAAAEATVRTSV